MSLIEIRAVRKRYGATPVLCDLDLAVPAGSLTAVLGPSGSGKTTLLRLIAGFDQLDAGTITIDGRVLDDAHRAVRPQHRNVGYVPQDAVLFPHLTASANIAFGMPRRERGAVQGLLDLVGLTGLGRRYPHQLSGGQQQRVALARALAIKPIVVLLDEPFGSLDASLRVALRRDVARILTETGTTTVLVTHDQDEAMALASQVAVLDHGRIIACADPRALYRDPADLAAATAIGDANVLDAEISDEQADCALGTVAIHTDGHPHRDGPSLLLIRPEQIAVHLQPVAGCTHATVVDVEYHGHDELARLRLDDPGEETVQARVPGHLLLTPGQDVWVRATSPARAWPNPRPAQ
jgi:iron(III) transport system ATP-binding protein